MGRLGDRACRGRGVAGLPVIGAIVLSGRVQLRRVGCKCRYRIDCVRQGFVVNADRLDTILRVGRSSADHQSDWLAHVAYAVGRERMPNRFSKRAAVAIADATTALDNERGDGSNPAGREFTAGKHCDYAG